MSQSASKTKMPLEGVKTIHVYDREQIASLFEGAFLASSKADPSLNDQDDMSGFVENNSTYGHSDSLSHTDLENLSVSDKMFCSTCEESFIDRAEQILHYKSDWHRFNLKQKLKGEYFFSKDKFMEVTGEISSISGSETDSETEPSAKKEMAEDSSEEEESYHIEGIGRRHPRVFLRNNTGELFSVYRCLLYGKRNQPETAEDLVKLAIQIPEKLKWIVIMVGGGHFAAAVFDGNQVVVHKTFHRYVVRAKRGTAQSTHDSQGGHAKSVGAFLRRHHEAALYEDIKKLLIEWSGHLKSCDSIFLRAPGSNQKSLFAGKDSPLNKHDVRLHMVPFPTRRPTFNEVKRVHEILATVYCYGTDSKLTDHISPLKPKKHDKVKLSSKTERKGDIEINKEKMGISLQPVLDDMDSSDSDIELVCNSETLNMEELKEFDISTKHRRKRKKKNKESKISHSQTSGEVQGSEVENTSQEVKDVFCGLRNDIYTAVKVGNLESLKSLMQQLQSNDADMVAVMNESVSLEGNRLLHLAAHHSHASLIRWLLDSGADPSLRNVKNELPYVLCKDKETRNEFRRFVADFPEKYNYAAAQIPGPLTTEMEEEKRAKEGEKRKLQKKARRERQKIQKQEQEVKRKEIEDKEQFLNLSDREKRALAAERRFTSQLKDQGASHTPTLSRCFLCGVDMTGKVPFEYSDNKFCSTKCLKQHRLKSNS